MTATSSTKKKRVSKRNKTAWRKHTDVKDVDEFLEDQRLEERIGKFSEKKDDELFVVDTAGGSGEPEQSQKVPLTRKQLRRQKLPDTPKWYQILIPQSKVEDPNRKRNTVKPVGSAPTALSKLSTARKLRTGVLQQRLADSKRDRQAMVQEKLKARRSRCQFQKDIWTEEQQLPEELSSEVLPEEAVLHNLGARRPMLRPNLRPASKPLAHEAVPAPHPGLSYNPTYQEHQELLRQMAEREEQLMRRERHLHRVTTNMFARCTHDQKETQWLTEMMAGLPEVRPASNMAPGQQQQEGAEGDEASGDEYRAVNPPVQNKKKDLKTRRKQREQLQLKEKLKQAKIDKKKIADIYKLRFLESALERAETRLARVHALKTEARERRRRAKLPQLGPCKLPPPELPYSAPADLQPALRQLHPTDNPLRERYERLQVRGALAAARPRLIKKRRLKPFWKRGHKVTELDAQPYLDAHRTRAAAPASAETRARPATKPSRR